MLKNRLISGKLKSLSEVFPIIAVTGARQVGKTTLLHEIFGADFDYVVFDPTIDIENARSDPDLFLSNHKTPIILDEVQYVPELVAAIKRRVDANRNVPGQYFLTGSQQWGVLKSMSESLAGRVVFLDLDGFSLIEIAGLEKHRPWFPLWLEDPDRFLNAPSALMDQVGAFEQIWRGWLPNAQTIPLETVSPFYEAYHRTYIERDVRLMADVSDWQLFGRFVRLASAMTAQEINFSQLGRELGITPQTSKRWIELLKATFQWFEIPAFSTNSIKKISNKPKGYFSNSGSICMLQAMSTPAVLAGHPMWGHILETVVVAEIRKQAAVLPSRPNFYHWRAYSGAEVDLIVEWNGRYFPIEVKGASYPKKNDVRGIKAFREAYPKLDIAPGLVVCTCPRTFAITDTDYAIPWNLCLT